MALPITDPPAATAQTGDDIKQVPQEGDVRDAVRSRAAALAGDLDRNVPPTLEQLRASAGQILEDLELPDVFLGFAMVAVDNAFWSADFRAVRPERRLLLLPKCLSNSEQCRGVIDSVGLHCAECGGCAIVDLKARAEGLGYRVIVAEGTSAVVGLVLEGEADAVLGVACLDSLEKSFARIADLGIPHQAIPLLSDGCKDTTAELELIRETLAAYERTGTVVTRSYLPLLRETNNIFEPAGLAAMLDAAAATPAGDGTSRELLAATDRIARDFLHGGGKRLRPFITISAYAVGRHGVKALEPRAEVAGLIPAGVRRIAVAFEALHKASLVHDDIEDQDPFRYGQPTLHSTYGIAAAINVGDYLVGLGYRLIAGQAAELGAECVTDILGRLAQAHLQLCSGQGAELLWNGRPSTDLRPIHALQLGALKTAPAFEVALYAGLRAAEVQVDDDTLRQFATYVGEGFQVLNDLRDWEADSTNKVHSGLDVLSKRPTILRAFAVEAGGAERLAPLLGNGHAGLEAAEVIAAVRALYSELGVFEKADLLYAGLRGRALALAADLGDPALQELLRFLVRNILAEHKAPVEARGS